VAQFHLFYALHQLKQHDFTAAEANLQTAAAAVDDVRLGTVFANPDDLVVGFIDLYEAWGRPAEAAEYRRLRDESLQMAIGLR
jgi:hypothetical protein